jgi:hypothetical protein
MNNILKLKHKTCKKNQISVFELKNSCFLIIILYYRIELDILEDKYSTLLRYPLNIKKFLFDYKYSKFHDCNRTLADFTLKKMGESYKQNYSRNVKIMRGIRHLSKTIEFLNKPYFLFGGTLLGILLI